MNCVSRAILITFYFYTHRNNAPGLDISYLTLVGSISGIICVLYLLVCMKDEQYCTLTLNTATA